MVDLGWIARNLADVAGKSLEHIQLTLTAVFLGLAISFPLAVLAYRHSRAYPPITWVSGILYTIPSLALFAFLVPYTGLTTLTAEIGLVSYTLLILIRNIHTGLQSVPAEVKEAAQGMGFSRRQSLWRVELPLALPVILAGMRIATVTTVGLVTVTALIGKGGLGYFILLGLERGFATAAILGAVLSMLLAVALDGLILLFEKTMMPWARGAAGRRAGAPGIRGAGA